MKPTLAFATLITIGLLMSCGGRSSPLSLAVQPATASATYFGITGEFEDAILTATLSNGDAPTGLQWKTSDPSCIVIAGTNANSVDIACSAECANGDDEFKTATITATAQGLTGTSSVSCTWTYL